MPTKTRMPNYAEIILVLVIFITTMFSFMTLLDLPIQLALFISWFVLILLGLRLGHSYKNLQQSILKGIFDGLEATLVLVVVGALIGTWIAGGVVPSLIYYGLQMIHPSIFLLATMILCAITSLATGTSFGTAGTAGIAMMGIGASFGVPLPLVAGAVLAGAYTGDKLSPLSDTTVMTASLSKVDIIEHVKSMLYVDVPAFLISGVLFTLVGFLYVGGTADLSQAEEVSNALAIHFNVSWYVLIPAVVVIALLALKKPAIPTIAFGALLGSMWAVLFQGMNGLDAVNALYNGFSIDSGIAFLDDLLNRGGIAYMFDVIILIIFALGLGGLLEFTGVLKVISHSFTKWITNPGRLTVSTVTSGFIGNFFGGAAYVSVITGTKMTEENYDKMRVDRRVLSRNTEAGGTITTPMVPWSDGGVFMATVLGVSTLSYLPFMWFNFITIAITIFYGFTGKFIWYVDEKKTAFTGDNEQTVGVN